MTIPSDVLRIKNFIRDSFAAGSTFNANDIYLNEELEPADADMYQALEELVEERIIEEMFEYPPMTHTEMTYVVI